MQSKQHDTLYNTTLALAGIVQAAALIREVAQTGKMPDAAYEASIYSIFQTESQDLNSIYGNISAVKLGLEKLIQAFTPRSNGGRSIMRYIMALLYLQKKLTRSPTLLHDVTHRISKIKKQVDYFHLTHPTVIANLADTYLSTTHKFRFRLVIWGSQRSLSAIDNMNKIRALLLAGVRSAVLWRQLGGSRLQLLFSRAKIKAMAEKILSTIEGTT